MISFVFTELSEHFGYSIEYIKEEYREKFVRKVSMYCEKIVNWFETYRNEQ